MKKIINSFLLTIVGCFFLACNDILEENPVSLATADSYYSTPQGINDGLKAVYAPLRDFYGQEGGFFLTVTGTDIFTNGLGGIRNRPQINNYSQNFLGTDSYVTDLWNNFYEGINQANTVISRVTNVEELNETEKNRISGEARFLRALYYFHLVQQFGPVHFTLEETIGVETEANRTSIETIYQEGIVPDLYFAIEHLPVETNEYGRVIKPVAEALMARVNLTIENWAEAEVFAKSVIENYNFELVTPYADLWDINNDENSEIIWAVQFTDDPQTNGNGNQAHLYFIWDYSSNPALSRSLTYGRAFHRFMPTNYLLNLYDRFNDTRWEGSYNTVWIADTKAEINGHIVNPGDTAIKIVMNEVPDEVQETSPYWLIDFKNSWVGDISYSYEVGYRRLTYPSLIKYMDPLRESVNETRGRRDFPVIRLAEMYLIAAEAAWRQDKLQTAADYINVIRMRAALPGREDEMLVAGSDINLEFILDERARELVGEKHRWYDLKRTETLLERVRTYNLDAAPNIQEMHLVRPIPQTQIDRVSNPGDFTQNEGY